MKQQGGMSGWRTRIRLPIRVRRTLGAVAASATAGFVVLAVSDKAALNTTLTYVHALNPDEGVFAYARISPDGRHLAYASEHQRDQAGAPPQRTIRIIDLSNHREVFAEDGIDAYWSPDGRRAIYLSKRETGKQVSIFDLDGHTVVRDVAPSDVGDYYSWGRRDGRDVILTIKGNYFELERDHSSPIRTMPTCSGLGIGLRPLLSKDTRRVTVFTMDGFIGVRNLADCDDIIVTRMPGGKADFSDDGRYVAFHSPKESPRSGYEIWVIDLQRMVRIRVTALPGSSLFPSWTHDGRLCFRYDSPTFRGFVIGDNFLHNTSEPLPPTVLPRPSLTQWEEVFTGADRPRHKLALVLVWAPWSAHSPEALDDFDAARRHLGRLGWDVVAQAAAEPGSRPEDVNRFLARHKIDVPHIRLADRGLLVSRAQNQMPTTLAFIDGQLVDKRLGAQRDTELIDWAAALLRNSAAADRRQPPVHATPRAAAHEARR